MWFSIRSTVVAVKSGERVAAFFRAFYRCRDMVIPWVLFPPRYPMAEASVHASKLRLRCNGNGSRHHAAEMFPVLHENNLVSASQCIKRAKSKAFARCRIIRPGSKEIYTLGSKLADCVVVSKAVNLFRCFLHSAQIRWTTYKRNRREV